MYAASKTGGAARLNVWLVVDGVFEDFLSFAPCLLPSGSPVDGAAREQALFSWLKVADVTDGMCASTFRKMEDIT